MSKISNREQRRAQARAEEQNKKQMTKIISNKKTPAKARQGCMGCLTIVGLILILILTISGIIGMNKNRKKEEPAKKPTVTQQKEKKK